MNTIIQLTFGQLLSSTIFFLLSVGALQWFISNWFKTRLEQSIRHEYEKQLEEYKFNLSKREKVSNVAALLSEWIKYRGNEEKWLHQDNLIDYYKKLTQMSFELALWVEDESLLKDLMKKLRNEDGSQDIVSLLVKAKELITKEKSSLEAQDITFWPKDDSFLAVGRKK